MIVNKVFEVSIYDVAIFRFCGLRDFVAIFFHDRLQGFDHELKIIRSMVVKPNQFFHYRGLVFNFKQTAKFLFKLPNLAANRALRRFLHAPAIFFPQHSALIEFFFSARASSTRAPARVSASPSFTGSGFSAAPVSVLAGT